MRSTFVAVVTTMVVVAVSPTFAAKRSHHPTPAFASERQSQPTPASQSQNQPKPSYDACATLSVQRGVAPGQGSNNPENHHTAFMRQCQDGKIPIGQ
jgi:DNA polymerase III gamma/tau subunit